MFLQLIVILILKSGSSNEEIYDGNVLASSENVIVASMNYRLGVYGFLYLNNSKVPGNLALVDQLLAVEWYKEKYLNYFGGLVNNVCLFGESAGAETLNSLIQSKKRNLFNRAIFQSGEFDISRKDSTEVYENSLVYLRKTRCVPYNFQATSQITQTIIDCLLKMDPKRLISIQNGHFWYPTSSFIEKGIIINHDVLIGFTQNEATTFLNDRFNPKYISDSEQTLDNDPEDDTIYNNNFVINRLKDYFPDLSKSYLKCISDLYTLTNNIFLNDNYQGTLNYNLDNDANQKLNSRSLAWKKISKISSDMTYDCAGIDFRNQLKTTGKKLMFNFNKRPNIKGFSTNPLWFGCTHADELAYVFGIPFLYSTIYSINDNERLQSGLIMNYWANFAKTGHL